VQQLYLLPGGQIKGPVQGKAQPPDKICTHVEQYTCCYRTCYRGDNGKQPDARWNDRNTTRSTGLHERAAGDSTTPLVQSRKQVSEWVGLICLWIVRLEETDGCSDNVEDARCCYSDDQSFEPASPKSPSHDSSFPNSNSEQEQRRD